MVVCKGCDLNFKRTLKNHLSDVEITYFNYSKQFKDFFAIPTVYKTEFVFRRSYKLTRRKFEKFSLTKY